MKISSPHISPLYMQVRDYLINQITEGNWKPGDMIPSEILLSQQFNVSPGTARRAVTELVEMNILVRRQGRGTFVSNHDHNRALFHFFNIVSDTQVKALPKSTTLSCCQKKATRQQAEILQLAQQEKVIFIERVRLLNGKSVIFETITLSASRFKNLAKYDKKALPNNLYELYESKFGVTIHRADEQLRAVLATNKEAKHLNVAQNTALLEIRRVARSLDDTPVELRISHCHTIEHYYQNTVF